MVQRDNHKDEPVNYLTSIIQWIHNNPPTPKQQQQAATTAAAAEHQNNSKTNPRQQLMFTRNLKRSRHRSAWRALPEFEQENMMEKVTDDNVEHLS